MSWIGGLAEWIDGDTTFLSVAFTWKVLEAYDRARFARAQGMKVVAGGPALFKANTGPEVDTDHDFVKAKKRLAEIATVPLKLAPDGRLVGGDYPEAVTHHNPDATFASRGCNVGCSFCIVPALEGSTFTLLPDFVPRPILCDNNLSGLPADYQDHIIARYATASVKMTDAQSGFEPRTLTPDVYARWKPLINGGGGPWRFAYDEMLGGHGAVERTEALRVMRLLADEPQKRHAVRTHNRRTRRACAPRGRQLRSVRHPSVHVAHTWATPTATSVGAEH